MNYGNTRAMNPTGSRSWKKLPIFRQTKEGICETLIDKKGETGVVLVPRRWR